MNKIGILGFALVFLVLILFAATRIIQGVTWMSAIQVVLLLSPVVAAGMIALRQYWIGIMIGICSITYQLPFVILDQLHLRVIIGLIMLALGLAYWAISKESPRALFRHPAVRIMIFVTVAILLRFLYDRPGSARFGGTGGGGEAYTILAGFLMFPLFIDAASRPWDLRKNLVVATIIVSIEFIRQLPFIFGFLRLGAAAFYTRQLWWILPVFLVFSIRAQLRHPTSTVARLAPPAAILTMLAASLFTQYRSRLWFALAAILLVSFVYRRLKRTVILLVIAAAIGLPILTAAFPLLPPNVKRSLSTVLPGRFYERSVIREMQAAPMSSEIGWDVSFRVMFFQLAWRDILRHPLFGRGWTFDYQDIIAVVGTRESQALAGGYHNGLLQISSAMGIPIGILFTIALIWIPVRFTRMARRARDGLPKAWVAVLLGWFVASVGQLLMNGHAPDFFNLCVLFGVLVGLTPRLEAHLDAVVTTSRDMPSQRNEVTVGQLAPSPSPI